MAASQKVYGLFLESLAEGRVNLEEHEIRAMLVGVGYTPNQDAHKFKNSVSSEVSGSGYIAGGIILNGIETSYNSSTNKLTVTASNLLWPVISVAARYIVLYDNAYDTDSERPLIAWVDLGAVVSPNSQSFYWNWPGGVLLEIQITS